MSEPTGVQEVTSPAPEVTNVETPPKTEPKVEAKTEGEPETVTISAARLRELEHAQAEAARIKGVAGRQAQEIARNKQEAPPKREAPRREAPVVEDLEDELEDELEEEEQPKKGRKSAIQELREEVERMKAEKRAEKEEAQTRAEQIATFNAQQKAADVAVETGLERLGIQDERTSDIVGFVLEGMVRAAAASMGLALESIDSKGLTRILEDVLPDIELVLGYRHNAQTVDNEQYRLKHPKVVGAPGVKSGKLPSEMTLSEREKLYSEISAKYSGGA